MLPYFPVIVMDSVARRQNELLTQVDATIVIYDSNRQVTDKQTVEYMEGNARAKITELIERAVMEFRYC